MRLFKSAFAALLLLLACNLVFSQIQYVNMEANTKWPQDFNGVTRITVYWENPSPDNYTERQLVQQAIQETWSKYANVDFVGWGTYDYSGKGIRIFISDTAHPHTKMLGSLMSGIPQGMVLNFRFLGVYQCRRTREECIRSIAIHEFGHALGIGHEQDRSDCGCKEHPPGGGSGGYISGGQFVTPCDLSSIMNYCNPRWNNNGQLSNYDVDGIKTVYGTRKDNLKREELTGYSTAINKLGDNQSWENLNLNIGNQVFLFGINQNNPEEIKTLKFINSGYYDYKITAVSQNKDGKTYYGSGSGRVYIDHARNYQVELMAEYLQNQQYKVSIKITDIAKDNTINLKENGNGQVYRPGTTPNKPTLYLRSGKKPMHLLMLSILPDEKFYIYPDGVIMVYNITTKAFIQCGQKQAPVYRPWNGKIWAWSFFRYRTDGQMETYAITTTGEAWSYGTDGKFYQYGLVYYSDL